MNFGRRANMGVADEMLQATSRDMATPQTYWQYGQELPDQGVPYVDNVKPVPMPMIEPDPNAVPPVPMPMVEPDPNAIPPVPMPMIDPRQINQDQADDMLQMTEEDMQKIVDLFKQYMNKSPQIGVPQGQPQQSLEEIIGQAVMSYMSGQ